jgi:hypothetical protein
MIKLTKSRLKMFILKGLTRFKKNKILWGIKKVRMEVQI